MSARKMPVPLVWEPMTMFGGRPAHVVTVGRWAAQVWASGRAPGTGARPWRVRLSHDGYGVARDGQCKNEATARACAEKRLRKAGA